jgi:8-oxo-dGTP pyrophosphatase MutT (NUDIX family)
MDLTFIRNIEKRLEEELPGVDAQNQMAPIITDKYRIVPDKHKIAGVLALLFPENEEWNICYIKRSSKNINDKHKGQISFPGGKLELNDESIAHCALRETHEEIGISPDKINLIGALTPLYVYASNFLVYPFLGFINEKPIFQKQLSEVEEILTLPINFLFDKNNKNKSEIIIRNTILTNVPCYQAINSSIWGATAMITSEIEKIIKDVS